MTSAAALVHEALRAGLAIYAGGRRTQNMTVFDATTAESMRLALGLGATLVASTADSERPWLIFAIGQTGLARIKEFTKLGADAPLDAGLLDFQQVARHLPRRLPVTFISAGDDEQGCAVEVSADLPNARGALVRACISELKSLGVDCIEPTLDTDWMLTDVRYSTGEWGREEILGCDDVHLQEE